MIEIELFLDEAEDETSLGKIKMQHTPARGDVLWVLEQGNQEAYEVMQVAHWVSKVAVDCYHHAAVYVKPLK